METAKIGTLFLVVLIALGGVGASYATWNDNVNIDASVTTGKLDWEIIAIHSIVGNGATITPSGSGDAWTVTVDNAYPGWEGTMIVREKNTGTIPLKFDSFKVTINSDPNSIRDDYTLKFYTSTGDVNFFETLGNMHTNGRYYYSTLGITEEIPVNGWHDSKIGLKLSETLTDKQDVTISFTFSHRATQI